MSSAANPLVDFAIIGVQKAGTTALFDFLAEQPALNLSTVKEVHFFDDERQDWARPDYGAYHAHFQLDRPGLKGEATPIYIYWPNALERIRAYNPAMRLILLLRDPVERAWSHWRMEYARGAETAPFAWCIREGRQRLFQAEPWGHHREFSYVERGFYGEQVERLFGLFAREQVLILDSGLLQRDANAALRRVHAFLGAPAPARVADRQVHVGRDMDYGSRLTEPDRAYLREVFAADQARLRALTGVET